jgi:hypothetical protein
VRYRIHVLGPKPPEEKQKKIKEKKEKSWDQKTSGWQKKKKKKLKKMNFFDPPLVELQKSKFISSDGIYICKTTSKTCSLNLKLNNTQKWINYTWKYDDGDSTISKNPKSKKFPIGTHNVIVSASYSGSTDVLWSHTYTIHVEKVQKPKKPKKPKKQKIQKTRKSPISSPTVIYTNGIPQSHIDDSWIIYFVIFLTIFSLLILRQRERHTQRIAGNVIEKK